jgi:predicted esterase
MKAMLLIGVSFLLALAAPAARAQETPGLEYFDVPATGSYFWRYVPDNLPRDRPVPVILFFHGSGGKPENYFRFITGPAKTAGCILVMPRSKNGLGWGDPLDETTVMESLRIARQGVTFDDRRIGVAGHSAGGAYAYLLAYQTRMHFSAVFAMGARFYAVDAITDPEYKAPIRMYYGTDDPNYFGGSYASLKAQWQRLGVPYEEEIRPGALHQEMYTATTVQGFQFVASKSYPATASACFPDPGHLCLGEGGRFRVEVTWKDFAGRTGVGSVASCTTADSGLFWFFDPTNWELLVKVLDGCAVNGHHWVFAAAPTSVEFTLTVTDTFTGAVATYHNPLGTPFVSINDTSALACP